MYLNTSSLELSEEFPSDLKTSSNQATLTESSKHWSFTVCMRPSQGERVPVPLFPWNISAFSLPLFPKIKILIFYVPCSQKITFAPLFPSFLDLSSRSSEINDIIPLFPINPGRTSCMFQVLPCVCISVKKLENANTLVENTASYLEL